MSGDEEGASNNELLLVAAKQDSEEILDEIFSEPSTYDINYSDGIGNTALHYAAKFGSLSVIEKLLTQPGIKIDQKNRLEGNTPLHQAVEYKDDPSVSYEIVKLLIDHGADPRILNKNKQTPKQLVDLDNQELKNLLQQATLALQMQVMQVTNK
nr:14988_t:CDS:2 [Entrophospora candida]CAG8554179.1 8433_t:CDS:2 [Entrophospora candida]